MSTCKQDGIISREYPWGILNLDIANCQVMLVQRWQYKWLVVPNVKNWTYQEKCHFHYRAERQIWSKWSKRFKITVSGSDISCRKMEKGLDFTVDIQWSITKGHWQVEVTKLPNALAETMPRSSVNFGLKVIKLKITDLTPEPAPTTRHPKRKITYTLPHEFGHTLQNDDEYRALHECHLDYSSMMNLGDHVRTRHLHLIVKELNQLVPCCQFSLTPEECAYGPLQDIIV